VQSDAIVLEGIEFVGPHGVLEHERRFGCRFRLDLTLAFDVERAGQTDRLEDTIDYSAVAETVVRIGTEQSFWLLERLAESICASILDGFPVRRVDLTLRKLHPPIGGTPYAVGVRVSRSRGERRA